MRWLLVVFFALAGCESGGTSGSTSDESDPQNEPPETDAFLDELTLDMVRIPSGTFEMGCVAGRDDVEHPCREDMLPSHTVTLTHDFLMTRSELTQREFIELSEWNRSHFSSTGPGDMCGGDCPVESVTWHEAAWLANRLSMKEGLPTCYVCEGEPDLEAPGAAQCEALADPYACEGYRLPSEAEWEWAARGGEDAIYGAGADPREGAWYYDTSTSNGQRRTHPVCAWPVNGYGLCDMSGNVLEWTEAGYQPYGSQALSDPIGSADGPAVARGGHWGEARGEIRSADRTPASRTVPSFYIGIRLVRTTP